TRATRLAACEQRGRPSFTARSPVSAFLSIRARRPWTQGEPLPHELEDFEAARKAKQVKPAPRKRRTRAEASRPRADNLRAAGRHSEVAGRRVDRGGDRLPAGRERLDR